MSLGLKRLNTYCFPRQIWLRNASQLYVTSTFAVLLSIIIKHLVSVGNQIPRLLGGSMNIKTLCLEHSHIILWKSDIKESDIDIKGIGLNAKKDKVFFM